MYARDVQKNRLSVASFVKNASTDYLLNKVKAMKQFIAFFVICVAAFSSPAMAADFSYINVAVLNYNGNPAGVSATNVMVGPRAGGVAPPTDIAIQCVGSPGCDNGHIDENSVAQATGFITVVDADQANGHVLSVDDSRFEIVSGNQLKLVAGASIDFETEPVISITITAVDVDGLSYSEVFILNINDVNEPPFDLVIDNNVVAPNSPGAPVGNVSADDEDLNDELTFSVIGDDRFIVVDGVLVLAPGVELEPDTQIPVTILVTDSSGATARIVVVVSTNPDDFVPAPPGPATLNFVAPDSNGEVMDVAAATCSPASTFNVVANPTAARVSFSPGDIVGPLPLNDVDAYAIGDPILIVVQDADQNLSPFERETVDVEIQVAGGGDIEVVTLTEDSDSSGRFVGYVFSTSQASGPNDCILTVKARDNLTATYLDPDDGEDVSIDLAEISPIGIVFDDETGEPVNSAIITLVNVEATLPAEVRGDGPNFALYPSSVVSGESLTDALGAVYEVNPGEYRFPAIPDGRYRVELFNAQGWAISTKSDALLQQLGASARALTATSNGQFALNAGSRGFEITVSQGALPRIDIPLTRQVRAVEPEVITPSEIEFLQFSANPSIGTQIDVGVTSCVAGAISQAAELRDVNVPVPGVVSLVPTTAFKAGQPIFVRVKDADQNVDPAVREKITIQLDVAASGDREFLQITETGPDTGEFVGYVQSTEGEATTGSCMLGVVQDSSITTTYTDAFDETDVSDSLVLVDPFGKLFSTFDGGLIDGITVTLINTATGQPADVFGDGPFFAAYPNPVISGGEVTDAAGLVYDFPEGEYRFPFVMPGFYRLQVDNVPEQFLFPTTATEDIIQALPGAPYQIVTGSDGGEFEVPVGPALHIDLPFDEQTGEMFITKTASKNIAAIGDFVQYRLAVQNNSESIVNNTQVVDVLPKGFRYQKGSLRIANEKVADPLVQEDGRTLIIDLPSVSAVSLAITYVTEVTSGAEKGPVFNTATVIGDSVVSSNVASARILVTDDLFRDKAILIGQVFIEQCNDDDIDVSADKDAKKARGKSSGASGGTLETTIDGEAEKIGLADARIYLEDGTFIITDENGFWHAEGLEPGTHVVQLDTDSIPDRYEPSPCNVNSRFAGSNKSQFVDVQGGTVWRADFAVQQKADPTSTVKLSQTVSRDEQAVWVEILAENEGSVEVFDVNAIYSVPKGWKIVRDSGSLDGEPIKFSNSIVGTIWKLGALVTPKQLRFQIEPKMQKRSTAAKTIAKNELVVLRPRFSTRSTSLSQSDLKELDILIAGWQKKSWSAITIVGHTDNVPIAPRNRTEFADNFVLSEARAKSVADYVGRKLQGTSITVIGAGDKYPIASNTSRAGRQQNRRVEFLLNGSEEIQQTQKVANADVLNGDSRVRLAFKTIANSRGKTSMNTLPLNQIVGFEKVSTQIEAQAIGSWDFSENDGPELEVRDASVQGLISIVDGARLVNPTNRIKFDLDSRLTVKLSIDGEEVPHDRIGLKIENEKTGKTLYSFIGVNFGDVGPHELRLEGSDSFGNVRYEEVANVVRVGQVFSVSVDERPTNISDGRSPVILILELKDTFGEKVASNYELRYESPDGLRPYNRNKNLSELVELKDTNTITIQADGRIMFNPVSQSGQYRFTLFNEDFRKDFQVLVDPEKRDWIMVGLAEGTTAYNSLSGNMDGLKDDGFEDELDQEGRVAFYAKGQVKGEYILTLAYDTDKEKRDQVTQAIDPNAYYGLYGDRTITQYDAESNEKLFLKLEKEQFYALFGDFNTGLNYTELSRYSRSLTGVKSEFRGEKFEYNIFASETNQAFVKDEIQGDGTSGLYDLSSQEIIINSDKILIETRDRFRSEIILNTLTLTRFVDYNIDYDAGTVFFKQPIFSQDAEFNPIFIIADYETSVGEGDELNVGGRAAYRPTDRSEVGVTVISEGTNRRETELVGADFNYQFDDATEIRAEYATTKSKIDKLEVDGSAYQVEVVRRDAKLDTKAYIREQEGAFGLGQQNDSESGTRKFGVDAIYQVTDEIEANAQAYRETDLGTDLAQDVATTSMRYQSGDLGLDTGLRTASAETLDGDDRVSNQILAGANYRVLDGRLGLSANADAIISNNDEVGDFPKRLRVGLDYKLTDDITIRAEQEFSWGDQQDSDKTRIGMTSSLWEGGELITSVEQDNGENSERLAALAGLKQRWNMNDTWSFDFGVDRSQTMKNETRKVPDLEVTTVYSSPDNNDFTAVTFGSQFREEAWDWATRVEYRASDSDDRFNFVSDVIHNLEDGQQLLAKVNVRHSESNDAESLDTNVQLGYSYRPVASRWSLFNRLDLRHSASESVLTDLTSQKIVNNFNANVLLSPDTQLSLQYGMKYVVDNFDDDQYSGFTDLYGMEVRHDMSPKWDLGFQGSMYNSYNSEISEYSYGVSVGYNMARNVWLSLGYNFSGFSDDDFSASEYTAEGVFLKYRMKFDQDTAEDLMSYMRD